MDKHKEVKIEECRFKYGYCRRVDSLSVGRIRADSDLVVLVVGLAMVLYQSYREEEEKEQEFQRRRTFHNWLYTTDLKEAGRDETERV